MENSLWFWITKPLGEFIGELLASLSILVAFVVFGALVMFTCAAYSTITSAVLRFRFRRAVKRPANHRLFLYLAQQAGYGEVENSELMLLSQSLPLPLMRLGLNSGFDNPDFQGRALYLLKLRNKS